MSKIKTYDNRHPEYLRMLEDWGKYRRVLSGGKVFITAYLKQLSSRETNEDFNWRKAVTYCPGHARSAVLDIRNSLYERMSDITRTTEDRLYREVIAGEHGGVDMAGRTLDYFIGNEVLAELLFLGKVGILVDKDEVVSASAASPVHPYFSVYAAEDILGWAYDEQGNLKSLLLRDNISEHDPDSGLVSASLTRYRFYKLTPNGVEYTEFKSKLNGGKVTQLATQTIAIQRIPFAIGELTTSLLRDVADYQVALLNMESSDVSGSIRSNFTLYTEQFDPRYDAAARQIRSIHESEGTISENAAEPNVRETVIGGVVGRRYPKDTERPQYIAPPTEPLAASMAKEAAIKSDIYMLVNKTLSETGQKRISTESRKLDYRGLETNLAYIGFELQHLENDLAIIWTEFQRKGAIVIQYPNTYTMLTSADRHDLAEMKLKQLAKTPNQAARKAMLKGAIRAMLRDDTDTETVNATMIAIDNDKQAILTTDEIIDLKREGVISSEYAASVLGIPVSVVEQANREHALRLAVIAKSQGIVASGNADAPRDDKEQSQSGDFNADGSPKVRGDGK